MTELLTAYDHHLFHLINQEWVNPFFDRIMPILRNKYTWSPLYVFMLAFLIINYGKKSTGIIFFSLLTILLADQLSASIIKPMAGRLRPCHLPEIKEQVRLLVSCGGLYSFPSSHATNHFAFATFFALYFERWFKPLLLTGFLWAGLIAYAQVYSGVHFPFDVIAGALLGILIGMFTAFFCKIFFPSPK